MTKDKEERRIAAAVVIAVAAAIAAISNFGYCISATVSVSEMDSSNQDRQCASSHSHTAVRFIQFLHCSDTVTICVAISITHCCSTVQSINDKL